MKKFTLLCTAAAVVTPSAAFAQSTGSTEFETIVVTGTRTQDVGGVQAPDTPKAKAVLTQEMISRQNAGQTILDTINLVPGVSFQNNDAYGSSGGTLNIRGFDSSRVSLTFDGIQLNDSGNYAIYSNQQLDPELIEQVNVNLGSTDVDSPTASAVGGTVNYRTIVPKKDMGGTMSVSLGEDHFRRAFGIFHTGELGPWGTRAWFAASTAKNDSPYNGYGKVDKQQYNARIWQDIGTNGDFVSLAGHYNQNRNNFFGSLPLRTDLDRLATVNGVPNVLVDRVVGPNSQNRYPTGRDERFYDINVECTLDTPQGGVGDQPGTTTGPGAPANDPNGDFATCGTEFDRRYNPSNTGNIRGASRFTLTDGVVFTFDPSYQYVKANGGGTVTGREGTVLINGVQSTGFIGGNYWFGRDLNGDGDILDTCVPTATGGCASGAANARGVTLVAPSQTTTDRYGVITGLRWDINPEHTVRVSYTLDHAKHRQTGEVGLLSPDGEPITVFPVDEPLMEARGNVLQKRDRKSYAILNQVSGEYRGLFLDETLTVSVGLRMPFFKRKLDNRCFTTSASGFVDCFAGDAVLETAYATAFPNRQGPQKRTFKYDKLLPNIGFVYDVTTQISAFASYTKGLSVPSTDNLYNSFFFAPDTDEAKPDPETTDSFDGGLRYRSNKIQAQASIWYTHFKDRQAQAFDPELNVSVFRNLGTVNKWGVDGSVSYEPIPEVTVYAFGSWNDSEIKDNVQIAAIPGTDTCDTIDPNTAQAFRSCAFTEGRRESGAPKYTFGFSGVGHLGPVDLGLTAKRTGPRYIFDNGQQVFRGDVDLTTPLPGGVGASEVVFDNKAPAYWLVNLDARLNLGILSTSLEKSYFQLNVYNLFDKFYVGGFGGGLSQSISASSGVWGNPPFVQIGAPRTVSGTLSLTF